MLTVVGIGASAGGLAAFQELFEFLPADTGMAFVLVQHLAPTHPSSLPEILARSASIPVKQAADHDRLQPNCVYIIPPAKTLGLIDGHISVTPRSKGPGPHLPIDFFFRSLAETCGSRAIGVVLSGTGSDGSAGMQAIKAAGGITIAQDIESAAHLGMPKSAIAAGVVDVVLPPKEIAAELARIAKHELVESRSIDDEAGFEKVLAVLQRRTNVDFRQYKESTVRRRILRRLLFTRRATYEEYAKELQSNPVEVEALYHSLLIGVTSFFRDPDVFEALSRIGFPAMFERREVGPVRVWVPGCAGGEEAYSIAMCLIEYLEAHDDDSRIQIFGTDLSDVGIAKARAGFFPKSISADISPARLKRFFVEENEGYRISAEVRELCIFAKQDLTRDPPFSQMDLISCRNMLIYLEPFPQKRLFRAFHYALKSNGVLLLGTAESVVSVSELFAPLEKRVALFRKLPARVPVPTVDLFKPAEDAVKDPRSRRVVTTHLSPVAGGADILQRQADRILLSTLAPDSVVVDDLLRVIQFHGKSSEYLRINSGKPTVDILKLVLPEFTSALRDALNKAGSDKQQVTRTVSMTAGNKMRRVRIDVTPLRSGISGTDGYLIVFDDLDESAQSESENGSNGESRESDHDAHMSQLDGMRSHLQEVIEGHDLLIEELRAANEEVQSSNEELQSTNEELETAKEELQSTNEELKTTNEEMRLQNLELQRTNADLANVFISAEMPLLLVGTDLRIRRFTHATSAVMRIVPTDVGRPVTDLRLRTPNVDLEAIVSEALKRLTSVEVKVQDDKERWWQLIVRPYETPQKVVDGAVITFYDIDASEQHVARVEESRAFAEAVVSSVKHPFAVIGEGMHVELVNEAFYDLFKLRPGEEAGTSISDFERGPLAAPGLSDFIKRALDRDIPFENFEVEGDFPRVGRKTFVLNGQRLRRFDSGAPRVLLGIDDVTLQRQATERLRFLGDIGTTFLGARSEAEILDSVTSCVVPRIAEWCVLYLEEAGAWIRHSEAGPIPSALSADNTETRISQFLDITSGLQRSMKSGSARFIAVDDADDNRIMAFPLVARGETLGLLILGADAKRAYTAEDLIMGEDFGRQVGSALDATRLFEAAQLANVAKTEFLATMSHELRTPLNAIQGYVQLLDMELHGPLSDAQRSDIGRIRTSQQHLTAIITQVLEFARIEAGHVSLSIRDVSVNDVMKASAELIEGQMAEKELNFDWTGCDPEILVKADRQRVEQILLNLLSNAMKFTTQGGKVSLSCTPRKNEILIHVRDSGAGISSEKLESIFAPFIQLDVGLTRKTQGTGLGLTISREFAEAMGGSLTVESAFGYGSVFTLTLPRGAAGGGDDPTSEKNPG